MNIFITGTDTDVGKTIISSWICIHSNKNYWKPIQTGSEADSNIIRSFSPTTQIIPETYKLEKPFSPYDSANFEHKTIDISKFHKTTNTVIEGAGGVLVPIAENFYMSDLIKLTDSQAIVVAKSKLGFLNHIFLTLESLRARQIHIIGIILNGETEGFLVKTIEKFSKTKVLAIIPHSNKLMQTLQTIELPEEILR